MPKIRDVWDRTKPEKLPPTKRFTRFQELSKLKILTIAETAEYLRITKPLVDQLIKRGVLEIVNTEGRKRFVSMECLRNLIMPVRSLNKRLQYLEELKAEVEKKINKLETKLNINEPNENNSDRPREVRRRGRPRKQQDS